MTSFSDDQEISRGRLWPAFVIAAVITAVMAGVLYLLGRVWWCTLGDAAIYINEAWGSSHTSQHLFDPYTFTHVLHGVLLFWLTGLIFARLKLEWRFVIATAAEAGWEVLENTNWVIEKYRENTAALDYFGDSIANSVGDIIASSVGFWIAVKFGWWRSLIIFIAVEAVLLLWIKDGLLLNVLMLIYPIEGIKQWQGA